MGRMRAHTGTHLVSAALHALLPVTCQRSTAVTADSLRFDFSVYGVVFGVQEVAAVEARVRGVVAEGLAVERSSEEVSVLGEEGVVTVPGATYPSIVSLVRVGRAAEPCCGTHLATTADVGAVVATSLRTPTTGLRSLRCLTGPLAEEAIRRGEEVREEVEMLGSRVEEEVVEGGLEALAREVREVRGRVGEDSIPLVLGATLIAALDSLQRRVTAAQRRRVAGDAGAQVEAALGEQQGRAFFLHALALHPATKFSLAKAAKMVRARPALILSLAGMEVKGKAVVGQDSTSQAFTAELWLGEVAGVLGGEVRAPRGQDPRLHANLQAVTLGQDAMEELVRQAMARAEAFASFHLESSQSKECRQPE